MAGPARDRACAASRPQPAIPAPSAADASGAIDSPGAEAIVDTSLRVTGWALDVDGIRSVEIRIDGRPYAAHYGISRPDVAAIKRGFPDSLAAGFEFDGDFSDLAPVRHTVTIVAINRIGRETILGTRSLIPPRAMMLWDSLLDEHPGLAVPPFRFLMMTSGVAAGGASEIESTYRNYLSRTTGVGTAVPILYMRTTKGASGDWEFDPDFDLAHKCRDRPVAEDDLDGVIRIRDRASACPCTSSSTAASGPTRAATRREWDVNDHLEQDVGNCQWTQDNDVFPDDYLKSLSGSTDSPELAAR